MNPSDFSSLISSIPQASSSNATTPTVGNGQTGAFGLPMTNPTSSPLANAQTASQVSNPNTGFLGTNPNDSLYGKVINNSITRGIQNFFPGKQVGQAIGTLGGLAVNAGEEALGLAPKGSTAAYDTSAPSPLQVAGDIGQGALTVAAPEIGNGATALGRIGANAALGAGLGATNAIANGQSAGNTLKQTAIGGVLGGGISAVGEGINAVTKNLPSWFVQKALPKLNPSNTDMVLNQTNLGSIKSMLADSDKAVSSYGSSIDSILSHPQYATETGNLMTNDAEGGVVSSIAQKVQDAFPNAQLDENVIAQKVKSVAPLQKDLVDSVLDGTATLKQQNQLRQTLDRAIYPKFTDTPSLTANKQIAKVFTDALRANVQGTATETQPIFAQFAKEMNLNKALTVAQQKIEKGSAIGLYDILAGAGGSSTGASIGGAIAGPPGAVIGGTAGGASSMVAEKAMRSPGVQIGTAKLLNNTIPLIKGAAQGLKAPLLRGSSQLLTK